MTVTEAARLVLDGTLTFEEGCLLGFTRKQMHDALRRCRPAKPQLPPLEPISSSDVARMAELRAMGYKLAQIGAAAGVSRQRIHQCLSSV